MNQKQPLCRRARDLDYIARPDQEAADRLSGSQFCFVVLHYLNARRSLPPGGCTETSTVSWRSEESQKELVAIFFGSHFPFHALRGALCLSPATTGT